MMHRFAARNAVMTGIPEVSVPEMCPRQTHSNELQPNLDANGEISLRVIHLHIIQLHVI